MIQMIQKLLSFLKQKKELVSYLFFGVLTTLVNFVLFYGLLFLGIHYLVSQTVSWVGAVLFAYVTNKIWVFDSRVSGFLPVLSEFCSFTLSRLFSFLVETGLLILLVDLCRLPEGLSKIPVAVVTVVLNYVTGKLLVFRKKNGR